jgi:protein phosphatase
VPEDRVITIPSPSLVLVIGPSGSGKSAFCARHFRPTQVVSSDACRALLADDEADQSVTPAAFHLALTILEERLRQRRLTVLDATSLEATARREALLVAARQHLPAVAIVLDLPLADCLRHDALRPGRCVGRSVIARQAAALRATLPRLSGEGFRQVHHVRGAAEAAAIEVRTIPLPCDRQGEAGPFDVIGDVHGCERELILLLKVLGYARRRGQRSFRHPEGRRAVFVGDLVDRGPRVLEAACLVMDMVEDGSALSVAGNHDVDLARTLDGGGPDPGPGTDRTLRQIGAAPEPLRSAFRKSFVPFVDSLPSHLMLDGGRLAVAHAGLREEYVGRDSEEVRQFALRGAVTGALDRFGLPVRVNWAASYEGRAFVVYGHTPVRHPESIGNTLNIDTGCVYGGSLTGLRYPERTTVSIPAARVYYQSPRLIPRGVGLRAETRVSF